MPKNQRKRAKTSKNRKPRGHNDHDKLFKGTFGIWEIALLHLQNHLDPELLPEIDLETLQSVSESFVEGSNPYTCGRFEAAGAAPVVLPKDVRVPPATNRDDEN